jgi:hypothetical protein
MGATQVRVEVLHNRPISQACHAALKVLRTLQVASMDAAFYAPSNSFLVNKIPRRKSFVCEVEIYYTRVPICRTLAGEVSKSSSGKLMIEDLGGSC